MHLNFHRKPRFPLQLNDPGLGTLLLLSCWLLTVNCQNKSDNKTSTPSSGSVGEIGDTSQDGITAFVKEGVFLSWSHRGAEPVDSVSAHRGVALSYFNDTVAQALSDNQSVMPKGSVIVKALYGGDRLTVTGHAVMAKIKDGAGADTWVYFEGFLPDYADPYYGIANGTCTGCHSAGTDYVRSALPSPISAFVDFADFADFAK